MKCEFCNGETQLKKVKRQHWLRGKLYIVENVDAEVYTNCGERYFHAGVLDKIDKLLTSEHEVKDRMEVEVVAL